MKRNKLVASLALLTLGASAAMADTTSQQVNTYADNFAAVMTGSYAVTQYPYQFIDTNHCFDPGKSCAGANPASPYAFPQQVPEFGSATQMGSTDAQVLIMETPPSTLYFAITPYLLQRYYRRGVLSNLKQPKSYGTAFESIADSVNVGEVLTAGSSTPGVNPYSTFAAFVMTPDTNTFNDVRSQLIAVGFPATAINEIKMPVADAGLRMLPMANADTFMMMLRMAYPLGGDQDALNSYISTAPFRFMQVSPLVTRPWASSGDPVDKVPGSGSSEPSELKSARDALVRSLKRQYSADYSITEVRSVKNAQTVNYVCIDTGLTCAGDNPDAVYTHDLSNWNPSPEDKVLIVGVDHVATGKATYISESVVDNQHQVGVIAASDAPGSNAPGANGNSTLLAGSALKMAGITSPSDPRYANYSKMYALTIGYDCSGEIVCLTIPVRPDGSTTIGIPPGDTINITARAYVDPATLTRPSTSEIIGHRVFLLTRRS